MSRDDIKNDVSAIKRWWPVIVVAFGILAGVIKLTSTATSTYDNKLAKKEDIELLSKQQSVISNQISELSLQIANLSREIKYVRSAHISDSIDRISIKLSINKIKLRSHGYVVEQWVNGRLMQIPVK